MSITGHRWRIKEELVGDDLLWRPSHGKEAIGRPKKTDQMIGATGCRYEE